jgi:hypothetical protein
VKVAGCIGHSVPVTTGGRAAADLKQTRRDPAQGPPDSAMRLLPGQKSENALGVGRYRSDWAMKLFTGWILPAALIAVAGAANAQMPGPADVGSSPYVAASDVDGPYAAVPPEAPAPRDGPMLLPPPEVYTVVRENGFSPLGIPRQRGLFYTIAVIDRRGDDGRLVIDARNGQIVRFIPAGRIGDNYSYNGGPRFSDGPPGPLPPVDNLRGVPRPPAPVPTMASRTPVVPMPKAAPPHAGDVKPELKPLAAKPSSDKSSSDKPAPEPAQQSAAVQAKPADTPTPPPAAVPIVQAKPAAPQIQPTQEMPKAQGLE